MTRPATLIAVLLTLGGFAALGDDPTTDKKSGIIPWPAGLPVYNHVVIVVEENKDYDQIIDNPAAPYINDTLRKEGANFTQMFGEEHNSQGNYFWLFSGSNQTVGLTDTVPSERNHPRYSFTAPNLAQALMAKGLSFKGYAEDLPAIGSVRLVSRPIWPSTSPPSALPSV